MTLLSTCCHSQQHSCKALGFACLQSCDGAYCQAGNAGGAALYVGLCIPKFICVETPKNVLGKTFVVDDAVSEKV